jgi:hypothetical protein
MAESTDGSIWPRGYWRTWEAIVGATYATSLTKLRAWSTLVTAVLYVVAIMILAYYFLVVRSGTLLTAVFILLIPWAVVVGVIEVQRRRLAKIIQCNLAAGGKPVSEVPTFVDVQFLRWKQTHGVSTEDLQNSAPRTD